MLFTVVSWFLALWSSINLLDYYLRAHYVKAYMNFVERHQLSVSLFQIRFILFRPPWKIRKTLEGSNRLSQLLKIWFGLGIISVICFFFGALFFLSKTLLMEISTWCIGHFCTLTSKISTANASEQENAATRTLIVERNGDDGIQLVIPGWNIPWGQVPLYIAILLVAAVIHEMGHMLAALSINVSVSRMGFVVTAVFFGAYIEIDSKALLRCSPLQKLGISCAGVWHNLVLALFAKLLYEAAPFIVSPLYMSHMGVFVEEVQTSSPLYGPLGLQKGNIIKAISGCNVSTVDSWSQCLRNLKYINSGFCVPNEMIVRNVADKLHLVKNELDCCFNSTWNNSVSYMCFYVRDWKDMEMPSCICSASCNNTSTLSASCVFPALLDGMKLIKILVENESHVVLYIGYIDELLLLSMPYRAFILTDNTLVRISWILFSRVGITVVVIMLLFRRRRLMKQVILIYGTMVLVGNVIFAILRLL